MNPSTRTRHLNQWIQQHSAQDMTYPALHGFLCARLVGPEQPDWQQPLAGLLEQDAELDEKCAEALHHLIAELESLADEEQLALPSQCRLPSDDPEQVFDKQHPLGQWCYGFSQGFATWPKPKDLNDLTTQHRFSLAAELCLFRDKPMAQMLYSAAASDLPFAEFCKRQRQHMKSALNQLLNLEQYQAAPSAEVALDSEQAEQWQKWFALADASRDHKVRLGWFDKIIADANPLFDDTFWQQTAGHGWSSHEARPLLAARAGRADCLLQLGQLAEARAEYLDLLTLCQADEPGCRYHLSTLYARQGDWQALAGLLVRFDEASSWLLYNKALMVFATKGAEAAREHLLAAINANPHIPACLLGQRKLPKQEPGSWQAGSRDEAALYALYTRDAWLKHQALLWLRKG
ncbi:hypothetical protein VAWG006_20870 [Aeromonas enteropelogenes]|uniref:YecA family protein n=1 Tax=Aeromonas sp. 19NY04SH05-1 TaxID=2920537 RepID=A0AAU6T3G0_9GAMM|nr:UPF0149 family protein [Aeromonas enteropelogenes]UBH56828.1 YecA family protein [Aeromonas enteropelogenes]BEE17834.1 hypothetical protein VAWG006_20870 [Aeromonas enteropelogenes]BEE21999.1 hypothetical protein VAWG007_20940 [Aeromonas enteropelogenes]